MRPLLLLLTLLTLKPQQPPILLPAIIESHTFVSTCSAINGAQCVENFTWPVPFNDASYQVTCEGVNAHVYPIKIGIEQQTATGFTVRMSTYHDVSVNAPSSFEAYHCIGRGLSDNCTSADVQTCNVLP